MTSLEKDLREAKDELIRLRSINLSANKDQMESLKVREAQLKDKVSHWLIVTLLCGHILRRGILGIVGIGFLPCDAVCTVSVIVILSVRPSVCLSVCLSHSWTVSTWFDLRS